tara:strand:- start:2499 stop:3053 length:555 start_codon:yes stop_codon:yes gene_type:complete
MSIEIKVGSDAVAEEEKPVQASMTLNARKSLDGNIMIFDHEEIDIVVMPAENKVVAFPKDLMEDAVYAAQDRLFYHLIKKGIILPESVHGGNVYGSLEGAIATPIQEDVSATQTAVFSIGKFLSEEKPYFETYKNYEEDGMEDLTDPDPEDSTELGEVPHETEKGSLRKGWIRGPYGMTYTYRY